MPLRPRYKRNPRWRWMGKGLVQDERCGAFTPENEVVTDDQGYRVNPKLGTLDYVVREGPKRP